MAPRMGLFSEAPVPAVIVEFRPKSHAPSRPVEFTTGNVVMVPPRSAAANASIVRLRQDHRVLFSTLWQAESPELSARFNLGVPVPFDSTQTGNGLVSSWTMSLK